MQYHWTNHAKYKMRFYRLSEQMVRGVIARPKRIEEGIAPETVAYMKGAGSEKNPHEIWVMVAKGDQNQISIRSTSSGLMLSKAEASNLKNQKHILKIKKFDKIVPERSRGTTLKVISAWRYPGVTKPGSLLPKEILWEIEEAK